MAQDKPEGMLTLKSNGDYRTTGQYYIMVVAAGDTCAISGDNAKTVHPIGVLQNKPNTNEFATIATRGTSRVVLSGNVTAGDVIAPDTDGRGHTAHVDGHFGVGIALQSNTAGAGAIIEVLLNPGISHHQ